MIGQNVQCVLTARSTARLVAIRPRQTRVWGGFLNGGTAHGLPAAGF
jgi:hypothetical protein